MTTSVPSTSPGRQRDPFIDEAVMFVALEHLGRSGIDGFSLAAVAADAGTTRPAIYRRWPDKHALLIDSVAWLAHADLPIRTGDPYTDLLREMEHFRHCISEPGTIALAGVMLGPHLDPDLRRAYQEAVSRPRWDRIREHLAAARAAGELPGPCDDDLAASMLTGSWYAYAWAGREPGPGWPAEVVAAVWQACGGTVPPGRATMRS